MLPDQNADICNNGTACMDFHPSDIIMSNIDTLRLPFVHPPYIITQHEFCFFADV
jgi:hypothetical protein